MKPLSQDQILISDISCEEFNKFGIQVHPGLSIGQSKLGGTGIFFNSHEDDNTEGTIIARIPKHITFSLHTLADILTKLEKVNSTEAAIVKTVLKHCGGTNETEIITDYMFSFMIILTNNDHHEDCPVAAISFYLEILSRTDVPMLDLKTFTKDEGSLDYLFIVEHNKLERIKKKYDNIVRSLIGSTYTVPSFEEYYHIHKVIKSRVLEIPQPVEDNNDDFYVNTTLVPLLDYANHQENNNSFFDIDKATNDVILRYEGGKGLNEVCIKYSPVNSIQEFVSTYGFIPQGKEVLFELRLDKYDINKYMNEVQGTIDIRYDLIMKWLQILPTTQIVKKDDKVGINYRFNPVPMWSIFTAQFNYSGIPTDVSSNIINDPDLLPNTLNSDTIIKLIEFQETHCDVIQGVDTIAITPTEINTSNRENAIKLFNRFIKKVCRQQPIVHTEGLTKEYLTYKSMLLDALRNQQDLNLSYNPMWDDADVYPYSVIYDYM